MNSRVFLIFATLNWCHGDAWAHDFVYDNACTKPYYAINYRDEDQIRRLEDEITSYRECIREYSETESQKGKKHMDAAISALDSLQSIGEEVLKHAPEDVVEEWKAKTITQKP